MKYIRTDNCVYEAEEFEIKNTRKPQIFKEGKYYKIISGIDYMSLPEAMVIAKADTIEELCDEFVIEYADGSKIISIHDNTDDFLREHKDEIESGYIENVYGAIWTSKGLIYVAKMNDEGKLVLI